MSDYMLRGNGLYLPGFYEPAPTQPPPPPRQLEFFAYATVGAAIPYVVAESVQPFWWLGAEVYELHCFTAYLDQYENLLMDYVEELLLRIPDTDGGFDYQEELNWKQAVTEARSTYYDKLGL